MKRMSSVTLTILRERVSRRNPGWATFDRNDETALLKYARPVFKQMYERYLFLKAVGNRKAIRKSGKKPPTIPPKRYYTGFSTFTIQDDGNKVGIRVNIDIRMPLRDYRTRLRKALNLLFLEKSLRRDLLQFILDAREKHQRRGMMARSIGGLFDEWFEHLFRLGGYKMPEIFLANPKSRKRWGDRFRKSRRYWDDVRIPDHLIISVTKDLLREVDGKELSTEALKLRLIRWKKSL
jgi:hypothetical protein